MYSRKSWGGSVDPFILLKFQKPTNIPEGEDPMVSLVIFEWRDHDLIGKPVTEDGYEVSSACLTHSLDNADTSLNCSVLTFATFPPLMQASVT